MEIKSYQDGDENDILKLFQVSFGKAISQSFWDWRYKYNPYSKAIFAQLMWDQNTLVGHYAVCPVEMIIDEKPILTALSMTTMTHPDYSGKGIFKELATSLYKKIEIEDKIKMIWGFPNLNSHYGFKKSLFWNDITTIPKLSLDKINFGFYPKANFIEYTLFDLDMSKKILLNNFSRVSINKSMIYLNWRYTNNPINSYKLIASERYPKDFVVIKIFKSFEISSFYEIDILEHGYENDNDLFKSLISAVLSYANYYNLKIKCINTWLSIHDKKHLLFEKNKFYLTSPITFFSLKNLDKNLNDIVCDFKNWSISMGDSDVY